MKTSYIIISLIFYYSSLYTLPIAYSAGSDKQETESLLLGTWVQKQDADKSRLRYIKSDSLKVNERGFIFSDGGKVVIYSEFGCQMPFKSFKSWNGTWEVKSKSKVMIDRHYPGEDPDLMKILKLNDHVLLFVWE